MLSWISQFIFSFPSLITGWGSGYTVHLEICPVTQNEIKLLALESLPSVKEGIFVTLYGFMTVLVGRTAGDLQSNHLSLQFGQSSARIHSVMEIVPIQPGDLDPGAEISPMSVLKYQAAASPCCSLMHHLPGTWLLVIPSPFTHLWPAFWCLFNLLFTECAIIALQCFFQLCAAWSLLGIGWWILLPAVVFVLFLQLLNFRLLLRRVSSKMNDEVQLKFSDCGTRHTVHAVLGSDDLEEMMLPSCCFLYIYVSPQCNDSPPADQHLAINTTAHGHTGLVSAIPHHPLPNAQPVLEQWLDSLPPVDSPQLYSILHDVMRQGTTPCPIQTSCPAVLLPLLPQFFSHGGIQIYTFSS